MNAKKIKKKAKKAAKEVMNDPLTKEVIEDQKKIAKKAVGNVAKRAKEELDK